MAHDRMGVYCPGCGGQAVRTVMTKKVVNGVRRRKECHKCKGRYTTLETVVGLYISEVKKKRGNPNWRKNIVKDKDK